MVQLKQSLDLSLEIKMQDKESGKRVDKYWNDFIKHFFTYIRMREKETREEIVGGISLTKLMNMIK